jgi:endonuclease YncB( thermonuclease family)
MAWGLPILLLLLALPVLTGRIEAAPSVPALFGGPARVADGDTLQVGGLRVRLAVADAPEARQGCDLAGKPWACGAAATATLRAIVGNNPVTCRHRGKTSYARVVAMCEAGGVNLSLAMVALGMAVVDQRYLAEWPELAAAFRAAEAQARAEHRGIWGARALSAGGRAADAAAGRLTRRPAGAGVRPRLAGCARRRWTARRGGDTPAAWFPHRPPRGPPPASSTGRRRRISSPW